MFKIKIKGLFVLFIVFYQTSYADNSWQRAPFKVRADLPVATGVGLPIALSAQAPDLGRLRFTLNGIVKSHANDAGTTTETLQLDGESQALELSLEYGLSTRWSIDLQWAYLKHTSGFLDGFIDNWHNAFGLSDGDRPLFAEDDLHFRYQNGQQQQQIQQPTKGITDLRLGVGYTWDAFAQKFQMLDAVMWRSGLSIPTGDADKLTGSEQFDWDIGVYTNGHSTTWHQLGWHMNLGYLHIGDDQQFGIATRSSAWFHSFGLSWQFTPRLQFKSQLDSHSALFDSNIDELAQHASQLTLGTVYHTRRGGIVELYLSEDLTVNRAADFSFGMSVTMTQ